MGTNSKKLIDTKSWGWIHHFLAWKSRPTAPNKRFLGRTFCSLERRSGTTCSGGLRPPLNPSSRKMFLTFGLRHFGVCARCWLKKLSVWPIFGGFLSEWRPVFRRRIVIETAFLATQGINASGVATETTYPSMILTSDLSIQSPKES